MFFLLFLIPQKIGYYIVRLHGILFTVVVEQNKLNILGDKYRYRCKCRYRYKYIDDVDTYFDCKNNSYNSYYSLRDCAMG